MKHRIKLSLLAAVMLMTVGCAHRIGSTIPVSKWEQVMVANASFSQVLSDAELGTESLVTTGVLTAEQAKPFIKWEGQIASDHKPITAILAQGQAATFSNLATVQAFVDQVQQSSTTLITSGEAGIKNQQTQQALAQDVKSIAGLAKIIMADIQKAKGAQ